jgi:hypothetical protein
MRPLHLNLIDREKYLTAVRSNYRPEARSGSWPVERGVYPDAG